MPVIHNLCIDCGALIHMGEILCGGCNTASTRETPRVAGEPTPCAEHLPGASGDFEVPPAALTARDYGLVERFLAERAVRDPFMAALARAKLAAARIAQVGPEVATLNSRVSFTIDGGPRQHRTLVHWDHDIVTGVTLAIATPLGLGLLGLRVGARAVLHGRDGSRRGLMLRAIEYQPEAVREDQAARSGASSLAPAAADIIPLKPRRPRGPAKDWPPGPDSPGPSAA